MYQIALRTFEVCPSYSCESLTYRVLRFQQIAWYFPNTNGYIVVAETHWNMMLNHYMVHPNVFFTVIPRVTDTESQMTIEVLINPKNRTNDAALICTMFMQDALPLSIEVQRTSNDMQTTVFWNGLYIDLTTGTFRDHHHHIDQFDGMPDNIIGGIIKEPVCSPNIAILCNDDEELMSFKAANPTDDIVLITSKKRTTITDDMLHDRTVVCHFSKASLLPNTIHFDSVYVMLKCLNALSCMPRAKRYFFVQAEPLSIEQYRCIDPTQFKLLGVADRIIEYVSHDPTGLLLYFLIAGCHRMQHTATADTILYDTIAQVQ